MNTVSKIGTAAALGLALCAGFAWAQMPPGPDGGPRGHRMGMGGGMRGGMRASPETMQRLMDGRMAGAKAALRLTPEQEKLWPAVEQAMRDNSAERAKLMAEMRPPEPAAAAPGAPPAPGTVPGMGPGQERGPGMRGDIVKMLEMKSKRDALASKNAQRLADALKPLAATLNDEQKMVLRFALAPGRGGHKGHHRG